MLTNQRLTTMASLTTRTSARLPTHELFNMMNNGFPIWCCHASSQQPMIRATTGIHAVLAPPELELVLQAPWHATRQSTFVETLKRSIEATGAAEKHRGDAFLVLLASESEVIDALVELVEDASLHKDASGIYPTMKHVFVVSYAEYVARYGKCSDLFFSADSSPAPRVTNYASEIVPEFLWLGDFQNGQEHSQLRALGITHLVDATNVCSSQASATHCNIQYLSVDVDDSPHADLTPHFAAVVKFVAAAQADPANRVLIHCRAGWSRSPSLVMACMMALWKTTLAECVRVVLAARPFACPNPGFCDQLVEYERRHFDGVNSLASRHEVMELVGRLGVMFSDSCGGQESDSDRRPVRPQALPLFALATSAEPANAGAEALQELDSRIQEQLAAAGAFPTDEAAAAIASKPKRAFLQRKAARDQR